MTDEAERYARVTSLVGGAYGLSGARLDAYLDEACGDDAPLRAEVAEMLALAADEEANAPFADQELESGRSALEELVDQAAAPWAPERIGEYTILRPLGSGGMGVVYEARQESPSRRVAIKLMHPLQATPRRLRRFRQESELLGRLQHPGIAQIFEAGTYDSGRGEQPFFAMELVEGADILTHAERAELDLPARMELLARVADAVQYAHERGVIHRDLKPDNVLVGASGQPRILDFGIARASEGSTLLSTLLTTEGQLAGTLGYMAPELLTGEDEGTRPQVDVYALGVLAFELLVGRPPREIGDLSIPHAVALLSSTEAPRASTLAPKLRGDVDTILGKALETDPARRYATPAALAGDLRRHLAHRPIQARPPSRAYRLAKFTRRHKALVGGIVATLAVAVVALGYALDATRRARALVRASYVSGLALANGAVEQQDYVSAAAHLEGLPVPLRGWEYDYLRAQLAHHTDDWQLPAPLVTSAVFDHSGSRMFAVLDDASIGAWDAGDGRFLRRTPLDVDFGDTPPDHLVASLHGPSRTYAILGRGEIVLGDLESGRRRRSVRPVTKLDMSRLSWDAGGARMLYSCDGARLWDGVEVRAVAETAGGVCELDSAGLRFAITGDRVGALELREVETGELLAEQTVDDSITDLAFSPDDRLLALAGYYKNVHVLDARTLEVVARLAGHGGVVYSVAWCPDGDRIATTSEDGTLRLWRVDRLDADRVLDTGLTTQSTAVFHPDGESVVLVGDRIRRFPLHDPRVLRGHESYVYRLAFSPDGTRLASAELKGEDVYVWDVAAGRLLSRHGAPRTFSGGVGVGAPLVDLSADARRLVATTGPTVHWDLETGAALQVPESTHPLGGHQAALGRRDGVRWTRNTEAVSEDGARLARVWGATVELYDAGVWSLADTRIDGTGTLPAEHDLAPGATPGRRLEGHVGQVRCVDFSRDGSRVATGGDDATVRIWDARSGEQLLVLRGHRQYVMDVQFSPDGTVLASASGDTTIRLWDTLPLHERRARAAAKK